MSDQTQAALFAAFLLPLSLTVTAVVLWIVDRIDPDSHGE